MFLFRFMKSPKQVGSITPSSKYLTRQMLTHIDWNKLRSIAELGPGTGVFTEAVIHRINDEGKVILFERDEDMRALLQAKFPTIPCYQEAQQLSIKMSELGISGLDAIISGLPFANFPQEKREQLMDEVVQSLQPEGVFVAFQYSLQMRSLLQRKFSSVELHFVPLNIPPAFVYVCRK